MAILDKTFKENSKFYIVTILLAIIIFLIAILFINYNEKHNNLQYKQDTLYNEGAAGDYNDYNHQNIRDDLHIHKNWDHYKRYRDY